MKHIVCGYRVSLLQLEGFISITDILYQFYRDLHHDKESEKLPWCEEIIAIPIYMYIYSIYIALRY